MITIPGSIVVKSVPGRRGTFCVGDLATSIGTFRVKDPLLDQFEPGKYDGVFTLSSIYLDSYVYHGKAFIEMRATVDDITLVNDQPYGGAVPAPPAEPDPLDDHSPVPYQPAAVSAPESSADGTSTQSESDPDTRLFGIDVRRELETGAVKLDPTIDRERFRLQRDRLKDLGFTFNAKTQTWSKGGV